MTVSSKQRKYVALALTVIVVLSLVGSYFFIRDNEDDITISPLSIDSWGIESGSYYPWIWLNSTDDRLQRCTGAELEIRFSNAVTREYVCGWGSNGALIYSSNGTWSVQERLSLQGYTAGDYGVDVYLNCTFDGFESPATYAYVHVQGSINLPSERPPLPRVLGITFFPIDENGVWCYSITIEDPDQDGDCAHVYASNRSGYTIWHVLANNTDGHLIWGIDGDANISQTPSSILVQVTDKDGPYADARFLL
ncbi:MAG: hypothetical protein JSV94_05905 [Methanobacteriota archaeon]|nr:MAG: hypothetical protein JSV94_05905 [Euryarchaeota archaeon]